MSWHFILSGYVSNISSIANLSPNIWTHGIGSGLASSIKAWISLRNWYLGRDFPAPGSAAHGSDSGSDINEGRVYVKQINAIKYEYCLNIHPGRLTWNLQITHLERKMIFQTPMIMFHVNLPGCKQLNNFPEEPVAKMQQCDHAANSQIGLASPVQL